MNTVVFILKYSIAIISIMIIAFSCMDEEGMELEVARDISINNDSSQLSSRMIPKDEVIRIIPSVSSSGRVADEVTLKLKGELLPPTVEGKTLQATSIANRSDFFVVSYNFRGAEYAGGIDLISKDLKLKSEILFADADISDISFLGNELYFAGSTSSLPDPAFVERISFKPQSGTFSLDKNVRVSVGSYVANSVYALGSNVYVTSGNDEKIGGGLYQFNKSLEKVAYKKIKDARWVTGYKNNVYALSGDPSQVTIWDKSNLTKVDNFNHNGSSHAESKVTIDVDSNLIFVAGGYEGLLVYDLDGNFISKHTFGGESVTNAVTAKKGKVFVSNGEGGVHVASYDPFLNIIGKLDLSENESVNHITLYEDFLYVASGIGGVKMIKVE